MSASHRVVFVQGGGLGLDQEQAVRRILDAAGIAVEWEVFPAGIAALEVGRQALEPELIDAIKAAGFALKTKLLHPPGRQGDNLNLQFRQRLGLFASVRPLRNFAGLPCRFDNIDILLVRETTEDLYTAVEHQIIPGVVQSIKIVTEVACLRFFQFAFEHARQQSRKSIHCIHKANILKLADGLFLDCFRRTAAKFPDIVARELIVDNACMQLVSKPGQFDMLVAGNLYGDLLSDLGAGLIGGISATAAISHGPNVCVYEAIHGGPRESVGANMANPLPLLTPTLALLDDLDETVAAARIRVAVETVLTTGGPRTSDLGGTAGTREMTDAIIAALA